jgi:hypothetical protein
MPKERFLDLLRQRMNKPRPPEAPAPEAMPAGQVA